MRDARSSIVSVELSARVCGEGERGGKEGEELGVDPREGKRQA